MSRYAYDIYPRSAPISGARLVRLTADDQLQIGTSWRAEYNGSGKGVIVINRHDPDVTPTNFADGNYVKVVDTVLNKAVFSFFLPKGTVTLLSRKEAGGQNLIIEGDGALSYFANGEWLHLAYVAPGGGPGVGGPENSPRADGYWHWPHNSFGAVVARMMEEAHDPDRPDDPLLEGTYDFTEHVDSAGASWPHYGGDWTQAIGTNWIQTVQDVIRAGVSLRVWPSLLVQAFDGDYGTDRSSGSYASGKVRFVGGDNIASDLDRQLQPSARVRTLLVKGLSPDPALMVQVTDAGAPEREGFLDYGITDDADILAAAGARNIQLRKAQTDIARFPILLGNAPLSGQYVPSWPGDGGHFWLGDTVTIHTGTTGLDYNNQAIKVAAITGELLAGGDDRITVDLGATFQSFAADRGVPGLTSPGGCNCPLPCVGTCTDVTSAFADVNQLNGEGGAPDGVHWEASGGSGFGSPGRSGTGAFYHNGQASFSFDGTWVAGTSYTIRGYYTSDGSPEVIRLGHTSALPAYHPTFDDYAEITVAPAATYTPFLIVWTPASTYVSTGSRLVNGVKLGLDGGDIVGPHFSIDDVTIEACVDCDPPPASDNAAGDCGTPGHYAACDHQHPWQTAANTPIDDAGDCFTGTDVETALQELCAAIGTPVEALDDLSDVTITSPVTADRLRYDGTVWRNSALKWVPVTVYDPGIGNYLVAVDGGGNAVMTEA